MPEDPNEPGPAPEPTPAPEPQPPAPGEVRSLDPQASAALDLWLAIARLPAAVPSSTTAPQDFQEPYHRRRRVMELIGLDTWYEYSSDFFDMNPVQVRFVDDHDNVPPPSPPLSAPTDGYCFEVAATAGSTPVVRPVPWLPGV